MTCTRQLKKINMEYRKIYTGLKTQLDADIIQAVFGQMSDGKWENSRAMEGYWPYIDVEFKENKVFLLVNEAFQIQNYPINKFDEMPDNKIKIWVANHIKMVIKDEGLDWKRDNREETNYLSTDWRNSKKSATVSDCYYVYEVLKGRNADRHAEYQRESMDIVTAKKILHENGYFVEDKLDSDYDTFEEYMNFMEEDFTMGVGAPLGADQGIPHSMDCCAVPMMRLGEPAPYGKIQKPYPGHRPPPPHKRHRPIGIYLLGGNTNLLNYIKKKKKKKKSKKRK